MQRSNNMNITDHELFLGPLFIVGMPRSGTKLLRDLLNEHPHIGIPYIETRFLPTWVKNWQNYGDLSQRATFNKFYRKILHLSYFMYMMEDGNLIEADTWYNLCRNFTPAGVFEALVRHDAKVEYNTSKIWGDKSPMYNRHLLLLRKIFPGARIIHIIRDVRDYCLSINKTWGKNMIRAAQRWRDDVQKARFNGTKFYENYLEVRYEDLITKPDVILKEICTFLNIEYVPKMKYLSKPSENFGDARGLREIKKDNKEKYYHLMEANMRRKIEAITAPVLKSCGYSVDYFGEIKKINRIQLLYYKLLDGVNLFKFSIRERGFFDAIRWNFNTFNLKKW